MGYTDLDFVKRKILDLDVLLEHSPSTTESASEVRQGAALSELVYKDLMPALPIIVAKLSGLPDVK